MNRRHILAGAALLWPGLAFFHDDYIYRDDLILLGRIEGDVAPLLVKGTHPLRLTAGS